MSSDHQQRHRHARREERKCDAAVPTIVQMTKGGRDQNAKAREQEAESI